jgi:hypothetical protein
VTPPHPDLDAIVRPLLPYLGAALRAQPQGPELALLVVASGRDPALVREALGEGVALREVRGHLIAALPLERVVALAEAQTLDVATKLGGPISPGQSWCLVLGPAGRATALVLTWPYDSATGRRSRAAN